MTVKGVVRSVDRDAGTASVDLFNGLKPESAPYSGLPPWPGDLVVCEQTGTAFWRVINNLGARGDLGRNEVTNPNADNVGTNLVVDGSFESGTGQWVAAANTSIAQSATQARTGANSLRLTRNTSTGTAEASRASLPCVPGRAYNVDLWVRAGATARTVQVELRFYDGAATLLQTFTSPNVTDGTNWNANPWMTGTAPAGATNWTAIVRVLSAVATEIHYVDDVFVGESVRDFAPSGAKAWLFDTTIESWTSDGLATFAWSDDGQLSGTGCGLFSAVFATSHWIQSPIGTSGEAVVAGRSYSAFVFVRPVLDSSTPRNATLSIRWYNAAGTFLSASSGSSTPVPQTVYTQAIVANVTAPATAAFAAIRLTMDAADAFQEWFVDTGALVVPAITRLRRTQNATYLWPEETAAVEVRSTASGIAMIQVPYGLNGDSTGATVVNPDEEWNVELDYINDAANSSDRNIALVAAWYDSAGLFQGITLGQTPITTDPGGGWSHAKETFKAPAGANFLRARAIFLATAANQGLYLANVTIQQAERAVNRLIPQGAVPPFAQNSGRGSIMGDYGDDVWGSDGSAFLVCQNPEIPVSIEVTCDGYAQLDGGSGGFFAIRVVLTTDNWSTFVYGGDVWGGVNSGLTVVHVGGNYEWTGRPVGDVYVFAEKRVQGFNSVGIYNLDFEWRVIPSGSATT